jgi:hypothetical protein
MPYLTTKNEKNSRAIARVSGGKNDKKIIYLVENDDNNDNNINNILSQLDFKNSLSPLKEKLNDYLTGKKKEILIDDEGKLLPLPREDKRETLYISGPEGSGKSVYASNYITEFKKIFKKRDFIIFSKVTEDEPLDKLKPKRIDINLDIVEDPIETNELKDTIVLFDDIDTISNKKILEALQNLKDKTLEIGRHDNIYVIITSHNLTNGKSTKMSLLESSSVTFFPKMGDSYHIKRFLKEYCGMSRDAIDKIFNLNSRWVTVYKRAPMYILYEKGVYLLS